MKIKIEIHYNAFETIGEQLEKYNLKCSKIDDFEKIKTNIILLYLEDIITDNELDKCYNRLHKQILKTIEKENKGE